MNFFKLDSNSYSSLSERMLRFDDIFTYPLGDEIFKISHGKNYFKFFERLGELRFTGYENKGEIAIVAASILRTINQQKVWYLCDLKVHPNYRNKKLTTKLVYRNFIPQILKSRKFYAISMDKRGEENKTLKILKHVKLNFFKNAGKIVIYSLSKQQLTNAALFIEKYKGKIGSISLKSIKDIVLQSTQKPMRLNHLVFNSEYGLSQYDKKLKEDDIFMFCTKEDSQLHTTLTSIGIRESSTATVIHHGMENWNWEFINTSEI